MNHQVTISVRRSARSGRASKGLNLRRPIGAQRSFGYAESHTYAIALGRWNDNLAHLSPQQHQSFVSVADTPSIEDQFNCLAKQWKADTALKSNVAFKVLHPAYQKVLILGEPAIPYILKDLQNDGPNDWFWALNLLSGGDNPVTEDVAGNMRAMADAWIQWGKKKGYLTDSR